MGMRMGAWDIGPFDNDTAADFANDLDDAAEHERIPLLRRALDAVIACDAYLDSDFGVEALAAVAIVASDLPGGQEFTSDAYGPDEPIPADLYPLAARAQGRAPGHGGRLGRQREVHRRAGQTLRSQRHRAPRRDQMPVVRVLPRPAGARDPAARARHRHRL
jgi:hypothetical protein